MKSYVPKPEYAIVYVPARSRSRFSESCVEIVGSAQEVCIQANTDLKLYAARVNGPSKSSEGQAIYYLLEWLDVFPPGKRSRY